MAEAEFSAPCREEIFPAGTLLGDYRIDGHTARSSIGEIYAATDLKNSKNCSVYVIGSAISGHSPDVAARLLSRAQEACFLRHRNFVSIRSTFSCSEYRCIVTERLQGRPLRSWIENKEPLPLPAEKIAAELAQLLGASEKSPKLFLEFTPDDVFITASGQVKLLYPGMCSQLHLLSGTSLLQDPILSRNGSFIAPEFLLGRNKSNFACAVYSLGALLGYILCGAPIFQGGNLSKTFSLALAGNISETDQLRHTRMIRALTAKDPAQRLSAVKQLQARGKGGLFFRSLRIFAIVVLLLLCVGAFFFYLNYSKKRAGDQVRKELEAHELPASERKAVSAPEQKSAEKGTESETPDAKKRENAKSQPPSLEPVHLAVRKLSPAPELRGRMSTTDLIAYCEARLVKLESELAVRSADPRLQKLLKERIGFRRKQANALRVRRGLEGKRVQIRNNWSNSPAGKDLRKEVEGYLVLCKKEQDFQQRRNLVANGKAQPFPKEKLKGRNVDFSMSFQLPGVPAAASLPSADRTKKTTTLALLLLNGYLIPEYEALQILFDLQANLGDIPSGTLYRLLRDSRISEPVKKYIVREAMLQKNPPQLLMVWRWLKADSAVPLVEEMLLQGAQSTVRSGVSLLHEAAAAGNSALVTLLLTAEAPLEYADEKGRTALFYAVLNGQSDCAKVLLEAGADPGHRDKSGKCAGEYETAGALVKALRENASEKVQSALAAGADADLTLTDGLTPLIIACRAGSAESVRLLLDKGADVNKRSDRGVSPLREVFISSRTADPEIFELLLKRGADPAELRNSHREKKDPLNLLCNHFFRHKEAPRFAEIMLRSGKFKVSADDLLKVCRQGTPELFTVLVKYASGLNGSGYANVFREALLTGKNADIIKLMLERKMPLPSRSELNQLRNRINDPAVLKLLPGLEPEKKPAPAASVPVRRMPERRRFGPVLSDGKLKEKVLRAIRRERSRELEELITEKNVHPDSIVDGRTLLQLAVLRDDPRLITVLLSRKADPLCCAYQCAVPPVILAVREGKYHAFRTLINVKPLTPQIYVDLFEEIVKRSNRELFLEYFFKRHSRELNAHPDSFLLLALRENHPEEVVRLVAAFYGRLDSPKHNGVLHQAVANRCKIALILELARRGASAAGREFVTLEINGQRRRMRLSALQIAKEVESRSDVVAVLRKKGAE